MRDKPFHLLTEPQRESLRLAARGYTSKQIGERLGKSYYTIDDRFERAVAVLGAADRKEAVRWFAEHEAGQTPERPYSDPSAPQRQTPERMAPEPQAVAETPPIDMLALPTGAEQERGGGISVEEARHLFEPGIASTSLDAPLSDQGSRRNDLSHVQRFLLIPLIAIGIAVGFGGLAAAIEAIGRLFTGLHLR